MGRIIKTIFIVFLFLTLTRTSYAEKIAGTSAAMTYNTFTNFKEQEYFIKKLTIKKVLEKYNAPLSDQADSFITSCKNYDLDCYLLPSIAGLESTFGTFIYPNSYNPFGWGGGTIIFKSWDDGIQTVAKGLRDNYIGKGARSVEQIAPIYSESPTWAPRVRYFMNEFQKEQEKLQLYLNQNDVEL